MSILLVLTTPLHLETTLSLAVRFARGRGQSLRILLPLEEGSFGKSPAFQPPENFESKNPAGPVLLKLLRNMGMEDAELCELRLPPSPATATRLLESLKPSLLILPRESAGAADPHRDLSRFVFDHGRMQVMLIRPGEASGTDCRRVLVPAAGGPHSILALKLSHSLLGQGAEEVVPFYVEADVGECSEDVGLAALKRNTRKAGLPEEEGIQPRVRLRDQFEPGLAREAEEGKYDLILVGASDSGRIRRYLFGSIPERLLRGHNSTTIAVVRAADPVLHRLRSRIERSLDLVIPQLKRDDRVLLFEQLERQSRWNFDFLALITLSTSIAALGLVQNSTAVVIGAMLVAPLMTPLLGSGLSLVQGNLPLALRSLKSVTYGFLMALLIGILVGMLSPLHTLTPELLTRCAPSLLDLGIAFMSGVAAAYCTARPQLSAALPGVAIAAALVPPIATTGISLSLGDNGHALGAATLFGTNVVAIILGSSLTFYFAGIRGNRQKPGRQRWVTRVVLLLMLCVLGLTLPLGSTRLRQFSRERWSRVWMPAEKKQQLRLFLQEEWNATLLQSRVREGPAGLAATLTLERASPLPAGAVPALANYLEQLTSRPVRCTVYVTLAGTADSGESVLRRPDLSEL